MGQKAAGGTSTDCNEMSALMQNMPKRIGCDPIPWSTDADENSSSFSGDDAQRFEWLPIRQVINGNTVPSTAEDLFICNGSRSGGWQLSAVDVPLAMVVGKLAPALTLGNTCVIKPPSINSLTTLKLAELIENWNYRQAPLMWLQAPAHGR